MGLNGLGIAPHISMRRPSWSLSGQPDHAFDPADLTDATLTLEWAAMDTVVFAHKRRSMSERVLSGYSWLSQKLSPWPEEPGLHQLRVWFGPLRGAYLKTPKLSRLSFALGTYQSHVASALREHARTGMVVYDLGAHIGYFSMVMSRCVGPSGRVFAFEPDPTNMRALVRNLEARHARNVTVVSKAVSDRTGTVRFAAFEFSSVSHIANPRTPADAVLLDVPSIALDDFVYGHGNPPPTLIKIDVEGAEGRVLEGAVKLLREARPVIVVEVSARTASHVESVLGGVGYRPFPLGGDSRSLAALGVGDLLYLP